MMHIMSRAPSILAVLSIFCVEPHAARAEAPDRETMSAVELFEESERLYDEGQYDRAAELLERAYSIDTDPILLYNLARSYEHMDDSRAIETYRRYLEQSPDAPDRETIERRIVELESAQAEPDQSEPRSDETTHQQEGRSGNDDRPRQRRARALIPPLVVSGVGLLSVSTGLILGALSWSAHNDALADPIFMSAHESQESAENLALSANVLFGVGGALLVAGVIWGIVNWIRLRRSTSRSETRSLTLAPRVELAPRASSAIGLERAWGRLGVKAPRRGR